MTWMRNIHQHSGPAPGDFSDTGGPSPVPTGRCVVSPHHGQPMRLTTRRLIRLGVVGAFTFGSCGGNGGSSDGAEATTDGDVPDGDALATLYTGSDNGAATADASEVGFGEFVSGTVALTGAEESSYSIDDPPYTYFGAGGCSGANFGLTFDVREADTEPTALQLSAQIGADLSGGGTGTYDVEKMTLIAVSNGDLSASRSYIGSGTLVITEHETDPTASVRSM